MRYLILLTFLTVILNATIIRDNNRDVVIDNENNLMWMDNIENMKIMTSHQNAEAYCEKLEFVGFRDWRLPHIDEYEIIVDKNNDKNYIHKAFKFNQKAGYWAETAHFRTLWFYADYMHFISGTAYFDSRFKEKFVRCLREIE